MRRFAVLFVLPLSWSLAQDNAARDAMLMEGSFVREARLDDASLVALMAQQIVNEAKAAGKTLPPMAAAILGPLTQAIALKNTNLAWRLGPRFIAFSRSQPWGDSQEAATSLNFQLDRRIAAPGDPIHARLEPLYTLGRALRKPLTVEIGFVNAGVAPHKFTIENLAYEEVTLSTAGLKPGVYRVQYRLLDGVQKLVEVQRELILDGSAPARLAALRKQWKDLSAKGAAMDSVEYILDTIERATREYPGSLHETLYPMADTLRSKQFMVYSGPLFGLQRDLAQAERFLDALQQGRNPLAETQGDLRMAFRSPADKTLQPYRLFLPPPREGVKTWPLIVALHGALGDENSYFERYHFEKLAAERGYIVACPAGRGTIHMYLDQSEKDVLDLLDVVLDVLPIDKTAVFMTGHSMGSFGTLQIGTRFPGRFAALAAVAGVPAAALMNLDQASRSRLRLYQGAKDDITPPEGARRFAAIAKYRFKDFAYLEHKEDDHFTIPFTAMPEVFDFFDAVRRGKDVHK